MSIRKATLDDLEVLTRISVGSFDPYNLAMSQFGERYVRGAYFPALLNDPHTYVALREQDGQVLAYAVGLMRYDGFARAMRRTHFMRTAWALLKGLAARRVKVADVRDLLRFDAEVVKPLSGLPSFGPYAVAPEIKGTPRAGVAAISTSRHVLQWMADSGAEKCWATVDARNTASQGMVDLLGFEKTSEMALSRRTEYIYWKTF